VATGGPASESFVGESENRRGTLVGRHGGSGEGGWLERQILILAERSRRRGPELARASGAFHGQDEDEEGLVEMDVVELRSLAEAVGHEVVGDFEFFEDVEFTFHGGGQLWMRSAAAGTDWRASRTCSGPTVGACAWAAASQAERARRLSRRGRPWEALARRSTAAGRKHGRSNPTCCKPYPRRG